MKTPKPKPSLDASEWDFRQIDPILLRGATDYEYMRTSDKIRPLIVKWLDAPLNGATVRQHIVTAGIKRQELAKKTGKNKPRLLDTPENVTRQIFEIGEKITPACFFFYEMIMVTRPDFPRPWTSWKVKGKYNENFKRVRLRPMEQEFECILERASEHSMGWKHYLEMRKKISWDSYFLKIDFFADGWLSTIEEIVSDFEKWLRAEVKRTNQKMRTGRNAQADQAAYPLKCLAALRLRRAGFTSEAAMELLEPFKSANWIVPYFEHSSSWTRAIQFAENKLVEVENCFRLAPE